MRDEKEPWRWKMYVVSKQQHKGSERCCRWRERRSTAITFPLKPVLAHAFYFAFFCNLSPHAHTTCNGYTSSAINLKVISFLQIPQRITFPSLAKLDLKAFAFVTNYKWSFIMSTIISSTIRVSKFFVYSVTPSALSYAFVTVLKVLLTSITLTAFSYALLTPTTLKFKKSLLKF